MQDAYTIGVPVLAIFLGILLNQRGIQRIDGRIDRLEGKVDRLDDKIDPVESRLAGRIERLDSSMTARIERLDSALTARIDRLQADLSFFTRTLGEHDAKIEHLERSRKPDWGRAGFTARGLRLPRFPFWAGYSGGDERLFCCGRGAV